MGEIVMLKPKQKQAAEIAVSEPDLSGFKIAERVGVDVNTYYRWKKNPEFTEYIHSLCEDRFKDMEKLAMQKLKEHIEKGNWKATQYVLDGLGYKPEEKIDISNGDINISITGDE